MLKEALLQMIEVDQGGGKSSASVSENLSPTLTCTHGGEPAVAYTLKIRGGKEGGGKGALVQTDRCSTISVCQDQYLFAPVVALEPGIASREGGHIYEDVSGTLRANAGDNQMTVVYAVENHPADSRVNIDESGKVQTLTSRMGTGGGNVPMGMEAVVLDRTYQNVTGALCACDYKGIGNQYVSEDKLIVEEAPSVAYAISSDGDVEGVGTRRDRERTYIAFCIQGNVADRDAKQNGCGYNEDASYTLNSVDKHIVAYNKPQYIVRRLTPLECERLQGYPDYYTDIGDYIDSKGKKKSSSDAARYKALGNSICLPPWKWIIKRLCSHYEREATMASLFDGIGGFPLLWEQINGKGMAVWSSEIEDFPNAVTEKRIG